MALFVLANMALHLVGVRSPEAVDRGPSVLLASLGIEQSRVRFPMASGFNTYAVLCAMAAAAWTYWAFAAVTRPARRAFALLVAGTAWASLLLVDSRIAAVAALLGTLAAVLPRPLRLGAMPLVPLGLAALTRSVVLAAGACARRDAVADDDGGGSGGISP